MTNPLPPARRVLLSRRHLLAGAGAALALPALGLVPARAQILGTEGATAYARTVGDIEVTALLDGYLELGREVLVNVDADAVSEALADDHLDPGQAVGTGITAHLVRAGDRTILIDAGAGAAFGPTAGRLMAGLAAAGAAPEDVGLILLTHMHGDHIGGLLADGTPAFPNAEVRVAEADLAFWTDEAIAAAAPAEAQPFFALPRAVAAAYGERMTPFSGEGELSPGVTPVPLPGHTPGHTGFRLASGDATLFIWADVVHVAAVQFAHPEASLVFDTDPAQAAETRRRAFEMAAADRLLVAGAHLPFPTFGYTETAAQGYDWQPEAWQYR
ncbi:MAG: MBL fold metallo-hydrolase [Rhodobacteraceae bacterium]|nr:MBL fold metallo-hydrolase [Paracoccaceae bacterium]